MLLSGQVEALKLLSIKLINTATLVYQLYRIQTHLSGDTPTTVKDASNLQVSHMCLLISVHLQDDWSDALYLGLKLSCFYL